jgi:hypothetical protein
LTYLAKDESIQDSSPVLLYEFKRDPLIWRYAALPLDFVSQGHTWASATISPGKFSFSDEQLKAGLTIRLPITNPFAATFLGGSPEKVTTLTVFRTNYDDTGFIVYWKGMVLSTSASVGILTLSCESVFSSLQRVGPRGVYSRQCQHSFGGLDCNVDLSPLAKSGSVTAVSRTFITVEIIPGPSGSMVGGVMKAPDGTMRTIVDQSDSWHYVVSHKFQSLAVGNTAIVYPPCGHSIGDCVANNNVGNYGGEQHIPGINPFTNTSSVFSK